MTHRKPQYPRRVSHRRAAAAERIPSALVRVVVAGVVTTIVATILARRFSLPVALMGGWDIGGLTLLALAWLAITGCDAELTRKRAASEDPGRKTVYVLVTLTSAVSLFAAVALAHRAKSMMQADATTAALFCIVTVAISWAVTHVAFTLRYAHLYYREDAEGVGGVEFPGGRRPTYFDFAYFAFTIGMTFQTSDVTISSATIRQTVLLQAVLAFAYNTAILAFALNLAFGAI
jgi:uncharacterized membrane protein